MPAPLTAALAGLYLHLTLTRDTDGATDTAQVHLEANGHVGVVAPAWADARDLATQAAAFCHTAAQALTQRAADDAAWTPQTRIQGG